MAVDPACTSQIDVPHRHSEARALRQVLGPPPSRSAGPLHAPPAPLNGLEPVRARIRPACAPPMRCCAPVLCCAAVRLCCAAVLKLPLLFAMRFQVLPLALYSPNAPRSRSPYAPRRCCRGANTLAALSIDRARCGATLGHVRAPASRAIASRRGDCAKRWSPIFSGRQAIHARRLSALCVGLTPAGANAGSATANFF
ncbi:hypothetical protein GCM10009539_14430 [Cryptosporangium japonicum]|uniref:Uncharacterized protein n=1 Tax=Cryptosporangium japonicum TaxID=80872 RepID=A0ABP3DG82_9ACTN